MNASKHDPLICHYFTEALLNQTDCKHTDCKRHLLYDGLGLDPVSIRKIKKYYACSGCDAYTGISWELPEIAELWGRSKQIIFYWEKQAIINLRKGLVGK